MNYARIRKCDVANGLGVRVSLFVSGCRRHCKGCFNPEAWSFGFGKPFTNETEEEIIKALGPSWIRGLSILGGEPMEPENQAVLLPFLQRVRAELPGKDIWLYTGFTYEAVSDAPILCLVDVVVDGAFEEMQKDAGLAFRGSRNQRILEIGKDGRNHAG